MNTIKTKHDFIAADSLLLALSHKALNFEHWPINKCLVLTETEANELAIKYPVTLKKLKHCFSIESASETNYLASTAANKKRLNQSIAQADSSDKKQVINYETNKQSIF